MKIFGNAKWKLAAVLLFAASAAQAVELSDVDKSALKDAETGLQKAQEADALFATQEYSRAATALQQATAAFVAAEKRDSDADELMLNFGPTDIPSMRRYGYVFIGRRFGEDTSGKISIPVDEFRPAIIEMWRDASVLGNLKQAPYGTVGEPSIVDIDADAIDLMIREVYRPVARFKFPMRDDQWREVMLRSRRAALVIEGALKFHPNWKTEELNWGELDPITGVAALQDARSKAQQSETEWKRVFADFKKAMPAYLADAIKRDSDELNADIISVKASGWMKGSNAMDVFVTGKYLADRRKSYQTYYEKEGKVMPAGITKPLETKIAQLKAAVNQNANRWKFSAGGSDAKSTAHVKSLAANLWRGAGTVVKAAPASNSWFFTKDEITGLPDGRSRPMLIMFKLKNQKNFLLLQYTYFQTYTGGGAYGGGQLGIEPSRARLQTKG